jgi:hypothetical protein
MPEILFTVPQTGTNDSKSTSTPCSKKMKLGKQDGTSPTFFSAEKYT